MNVSTPLNCINVLITSQERTDPVYEDTWFVEIGSDMCYHGVHSFCLFSAPLSHQRSIDSHTPKSLKHTGAAIFTVSVYPPISTHISCSMNLSTAQAPPTTMEQLRGANPTEEGHCGDEDEDLGGEGQGDE